jgi:hypothetical protein
MLGYCARSDGGWRFVQFSEERFGIIQVGGSKLSVDQS